MDRDSSHIPEKLTDFLAGLAPNTRLTWADDHATGPDHIHTSWVDVVIVEADEQLRWPSVWVILDPEDPDASSDPRTITLAHDVVLWRNWDPETYWWAPDPYLILDPEDAPSIEQLAMFKDPPTPVGGWTPRAISEALTSWCATNVSRPDLSFTYDPDYTSIFANEIADTASEMSQNPDEQIMIAPNIMASPKFFDQLLAMSPEDAADMTARVIAALNPVIEALSNDSDFPDPGTSP